MKFPSMVAIVLVLFNYGGCAGSRHYYTLNKGFAMSAPRFLELRIEAQVATLHFPAGTYVLEAADDTGFFYRAPAKILENSFSGPLFHDGGLYLGNSGRRVLRGYTFLTQTSLTSGWVLTRKILLRCRKTRAKTRNRIRHSPRSCPRQS